MVTRSPLYPVVAAVALACALGGSAPAQTLVAPGNLGISGKALTLKDGTALILRFEGGEQTDFNGDGDFGDTVPHLEFLPTGHSLTLPWAADDHPSPIDAGRWLLAPRDEAGDKLDLNADGDQVDFVPAVLDHRTGEQWLATGAFGAPIEAGPGLMLLNYGELLVGMDLNGDGDISATDAVTRLHDLRTGAETSVGVAGDYRILTPDGKYLLGRINELGQGVDVNGDGLINGWAASVFDVRTGAQHVLNINARYLANFSNASFGANLFAAGRAPMFVDEQTLGTDVDGDGLLDSLVFSVLDPVTATVIPTTLTYPQTGGPYSWPWQLTALGDHFLVTFYEGFTASGSRRPYLVDARDSTVTALNLDLGDASVLALRIPTFGDVAALLVEESTADLNGDGDQDDLVLHLLRASDRKLLNTGLAGMKVSGGGQALVVTVWEFGQFGLDRNGDGDAGDITPLVVDFATGKVFELPFALDFQYETTPVTDGRHVAFMVDEDRQGMTDLNGDGDAFDIVLHVLDLRTGIITVMGAAQNGGLTGSLSEDVLLDDGWIVFMVDEFFAGNMDLNGDGDTSDRILHAAKIP